MKTSKKVDKTKIKEKSKDDIPSKKKDEPLKKSVYSVSTPRSFVGKSTTADIYVKKNAVTNAPKKSSNASQPSKASPMKDILKSNVPISARSKANRTDTSQKPLSVQKSKTKTNKAIPINVTVNSPIVKRKLKLEGSTDTKDTKLKTKQTNDRQRTNTRTLDDNEVKILTPDVVDNNTEMANLSKKLTAKPKAFYVNLNGEAKVDKSPSSEEEVSYEDDFESYESDFESYKSSESESPRASSEEAASGGEGENSKEERMLDSGHFDMRETKSANKAKHMDFIVETTEEDDKKTSLTDEGFQEMSSSSGAPSMKTVHVDVLERPLFIDFSKSKENRRKRLILERLKQRAADILSMVTLHEMSYSLFEMKPIPYELFMATFGRANNTQTAVQTFDDGITAEVQTEEVLCHNKWTQHPIEFTKNDVCLNFNKNVQEKNENTDLNYLLHDEKPEMELDDDYKNNNLRIYLEQKDGVGSDKIMPQEAYASTFKRKDFDINKLGKFLKKVESRICSILSVNVGNTDVSNLIKTSKYPFSNGHLPMSTKKLTDKYSYLKNSDITGVVFSKTKSNLLFTIHQRVDTGITAHKCVLCLWDLSVIIFEPIKVLIATDNVTIGIFYGSTDGVFIGAIEDGSIQLWDLSEESTWCNEVSNDTHTTDLQVETLNLTSTERDRECNSKNRDHRVVQEKNIGKFQTSAFTTSAINMSHNDGVDCIVALEFLQESRSYTDMSNQRIIGQVSALQRSGILSIWSVIQEKSKKYTYDLGKAYWSRLKLQKMQSVILTDHIFNKTSIDNTFNLNNTKRRLATKRLERNSMKFECMRPNSSYKTDRPMSAASIKNSKISVENFANVFDNPIICSDLKIMNHNKCVYYLIAKNCGEVLCCARIISAVKVNLLTVAGPTSSITSLSVSPHGLHYFLAATDIGTINMCSFDNFRVLLTLDCSSVPPPVTEKYLTDHKGRFLGSSETKQEMLDTTSIIKSVVWSPADPFCVVALMVDGSLHVWELTHSDIHAKSVCARAATACVASDRALALITPENEVQVHKLSEKTERLEFFQKYVAHL